MLRVNLLPLHREFRLALRQLNLRPVASELAFECVNVSEHIVKKLGAAAEVVDGNWSGPVTTDAWLSEVESWRRFDALVLASQGVPADTLHHTWLRIGKVFIDPTARQFHARLPCPLIVPVGHRWLKAEDA